MPPRRVRQRARTQSESVTDLESNTSPPSSYPAGLRVLHRPRYNHTSTFKSPEMEITVSSPSVRVVRKQSQPGQSLPVFGDHDHVMGCVTLDPQNCAADSGRLTITIEGVFEYISPMSATKPGPSQITPGKHRHVFFQNSAVIPLYTASEPVPPRSAFRSAFTATIRRATSVEALSKEFRSNSTSSPPPTPSSSPKRFNFDFELPKPEKIGEELPSTFSASNIVSGGVRGRVYAENADVKYRVRALWEALDGSGTQAKLEAPILFQPDTDFQSLDGFSIEPDSWSETALSKVDSLPVECAVTVPSPATFPRSSNIPYFIVFTTKPRSRTLAAEFMADATIAVSLVRRVAFPKPHIRRPLPALQTENLPMASVHKTSPDSASFLSTPSSSSASIPPSPISPNRGRSRLLKRVVRSAPPILSSFRFSRTDPDGHADAQASISVWTTEKPLPSIPSTQATQATRAPPVESHRLSDSRTLHTDVSVGFPKRPKGRAVSPNSHPSLESVSSLPDGLYKGSIPLQKGWFPTLQWQGLGIEYFLQVSVIFDSKEFRARVPIRVY